MRAWARRVLREKRAVVLPLGVILLVNVLVGFLVVLPMNSRVAGAASREQAAILELTAAQRDFATATATRRDKSRAEQDLRTFYAEVLPADMVAARRATYVHLATLARDAELEYARREEEPRKPPQAEAAASGLTRFNITMVLKGHYESVRQFIRDIESSDRFIVIDNVALSEGSEPGTPLMLTVELSTYYRTPGHGF